jgi:hypothetical protein
MGSNSKGILGVIDCSCFLCDLLSSCVAAYNVFLSEQNTIRDFRVEATLIISFLNLDIFILHQITLINLVTLL